MLLRKELFLFFFLSQLQHYTSSGYNSSWLSYMSVLQCNLQLGKSGDGSKYCGKLKIITLNLKQIIITIMDQMRKEIRISFFLCPPGTFQGSSLSSAPRDNSWRTYWTIGMTRLESGVITRQMH